jgi:hypothetical protein
MMRANLISIFFLCFLAQSLAATPVIATRCLDVGSPCEEFGEATAVFIGVVLASKEVKSGKDFVVEPEIVFKGSPDLSVSFFSCLECLYNGWGYEFSVGEKYLIYANRDSSGIWSASACGRTRPIAEAKEDLEFLQNLLTEGSGGHLYGKFIGLDSSGVIPITGAIVSIEGQWQSYRTTTNDNGQYEMFGLMPGEYRVFFKVLEGAKEYEGYMRRVRVYDRGCSRLNFLCIRDDVHSRYTYK